METSVTSLIARIHEGDGEALNELVPIVYSELHRIAEGYLRHEASSHTLQPTALVHEAYLRLLGGQHPEYRGRTHFFGIAAHLMRQILVDHARSRSAAKRGAGTRMVPLNDNLDFSEERASVIVALDEALNALANIDPDNARMIELRFFGGLTAEEIAGLTGCTVHQVRHRSRIALAWLHREMDAL